jgi:hypothetical protein
MSSEIRQLYEQSLTGHGDRKFNNPWDPQLLFIVEVFPSQIESIAHNGIASIRYHFGIYAGMIVTAILYTASERSSETVCLMLNFVIARCPPSAIRA